MGKAEIQSLYLEHLREEGLKPRQDGDGDLIFQMEKWTYAVTFDERDLHYIQVVLPNIWSIKDPDERVRAIAASERATARTKVAKVYVVRDNVWVTFEMLLGAPDALKPVFPRAVRTLVSAAKTFAELMKESAPRHRVVGIA